MGEIDIQIIRDNQPQAYHPGETVAGRVVCTFTKEQNVRAIRIRFKGEAKTRWPVKRGKTRTTYGGVQLYFRDEYKLLDGGENNIQLSAGVHHFPFSFVLPQEIPSSLHEDYGGVNYTIKVVADFPWKFAYEEKLILKVAAPLDLNSIPSLREPMISSKDENVSCCCWSCGPINFTAALPARGFVPGHPMGIRCYVENMSSVNIEMVAFYIIQEVEYTATHPRMRKKSRRSTLLSHHDGAICAHCEKSWTSPITLPERKDYPYMTMCEIINISYWLKIELISPSLYSNIEMYFPIIIGTVPLSGIDTNFPNASAPHASAPNASAPLLENNSDSSALPSYSEALEALE